MRLTTFCDFITKEDAMKDILILYERKEECCGCTACFAICPKSAITMEPDEEGFLYPVVDGERCVRCNQCLNVCPIKTAKEEQKVASTTKEK